MKPETLQAFLLSALELRGVDLEKQFSVSHGVAVRARAKLIRLQLNSRQAIESLSAQELYSKWYEKSPKQLAEGDCTGYLEPDFAKMQDLYVTARKNIKTRSDKKTAPCRSLIIEEVYLSEENKTKADAGEFKLYSVSHIYKQWSQYTKDNVDEDFRRVHEYGLATELDFNGPQMEYVDADGNVVKATMVGIVPPASGRFEARIIKSQKTEDVILASQIILLSKKNLCKVFF